MADAPSALACRCGAVEIIIEGAPILAAACHCDDCQEGGRRLEALPGAPKVLEPGEGTDYLLVRRVRVAPGADPLQAHTLTGCLHESVK